MGDKSAAALVRELDAVRKAELHRFIFALGIRHVGETTAKDRRSTGGTMEALMNARENDLLACATSAPSSLPASRSILRTRPPLGG